MGGTPSIVKCPFCDTTTRPNVMRQHLLDSHGLHNVEFEYPWWVPPLKIKSYTLRPHYNGWRAKVYQSPPVFDKQGFAVASNADYLRDLAERLRSVPMSYNIDDGDIDALYHIASTLPGES